MYVEGRLKTKKRTDATGNARQSTEIIVDNFIFLDNKAPESVEEADEEEEEIEMADEGEDTLFAREDEKESTLVYNNQILQANVLSGTCGYDFGLILSIF